MMGDKAPSAAWDEVRDLIHGKTAAQSREEFNRWLTQHDREVSDAERGAIARQLYYDAVDAGYAWTARGRGYQEALKDVHVWVTEGRYLKGNDDVQ